MTGDPVATKITGGDLYHLWRVANVHLPRIADVYYDANRTLGGAKSTSTPVGPGEAHLPPTVSTDADAFRANTSVYPGSSAMSSSVGAAWADLRNELQTMYAQVGTTILEAGGGINKAMLDFADADLTSADELSKYLADPANHNPQDVASNPPAQGADDNPGEPMEPSS